jgi:hypothetical protein
MPKEDIVVVYDFITDEECNTLLEYEKYLTEADLWDKGDIKGDPFSHWAKRFLGVQNLIHKDRGYGTPKDLEVIDLCIKIRKRIRAKIKEFWGLEEEIYADSCNLIRWPLGEAQPPHADYENFALEPHIYNWRDIGVVLYLNDDFKGGQIYFPQHDHSVQIKRKMLAFFPGDKHHAHGVKKIEEGCRYTLNMFYTYSSLHRDMLEQ